MIYSAPMSSPSLTSPASSPSAPPSSAPALTSPSPLSSPSSPSSPHLISPSSSPPPPPSSPAASKLTTSLFSLLHLFLLSLDSLLLTICYFPRLLFSNFLLLSRGILAPTLSSKLSFLYSLPSSHLPPPSPPPLPSSPVALKPTISLFSLLHLFLPYPDSLLTICHFPRLLSSNLLLLSSGVLTPHIFALLVIQPRTLILTPPAFTITIDATARFGLRPETTMFVHVV